MSCSHFIGAHADHARRQWNAWKYPDPTWTCPGLPTLLTMPGLLCSAVLHPALHCCCQAVEADAIDILAVQAPDCRQLPDSLVDLLQNARTSLLIYHHKADDGPGEAMGGMLVADPSAAQMAS
jgi:hypothetical protein